MADATDTPTIEEAVQMASEKVEGTTEAKPEVETPEEGQAEVTDEANEEAQETPSEESQEDTPLDKFDISKLSPELQKVYKDMQKGFTQGRQKDRAEVNQLQKELTDLKKQLNPEPDWASLTPEQQVEKLAEQKVMEAKLNDFREQAVKDYNSLDKRLDSTEGNEKYDPMMDTAIATQLDKLLDEHVEKNGNELGFDYKSHAQDLIKQWDTYVQSKIDRFMEKQREMAKKSESKMSKASPKGTQSSSKPSGSMSLEQAIEAAYSKVG